eukprot:403335311
MKRNQGNANKQHTDSKQLLKDNHTGKQIILQTHGTSLNQHQNSRITNMSTQGSYSSSSFGLNETSKIISKQSTTASNNNQILDHVNSDNKFKRNTNTTTLHQSTYSNPSIIVSSNHNQSIISPTNQSQYNTHGSHPFSKSCINNASTSNISTKNSVILPQTQNQNKQTLQKQTTATQQQKKLLEKHQNRVKSHQQMPQFERNNDRNRNILSPSRTQQPTPHNHTYGNNFKHQNFNNQSSNINNDTSLMVNLQSPQIIKSQNHSERNSDNILQSQNSDMSQIQQTNEQLLQSQSFQNSTYTNTLTTSNTQQLKNTSQPPPLYMQQTQQQSPQILQLSLKKTQSNIIAQKCSFKDSFVDSENFMNVEEKDVREQMKTPNSQHHQEGHVKQKSMGELIKERFMGPMIMKSTNTNQTSNNLTTKGNPSQSFMKRNILVTTSNCGSNRSSTCSIKSSFRGHVNSRLNTQLGFNNKPSFQEGNETNDDVEEYNNQKHCCDSINQYSLLPKTIFNEIVHEIQVTNRLSTKPYDCPNVPIKIELKQTSLNDMVTQVPQMNPQNMIQAMPTPKTQNRKSNTVNNHQPQLNQTQTQQNNKSESPQFKSQFQQNQQDNNTNNIPNDESNNSSSTNTNQEDIIEFLQSDTHKMHLIQTLQSLQYVKNFLKQPKYEEISNKRVNLPRFRRTNINKTIIFDLDETLVHCVEDIVNSKADRLIKVQFPNGEVATAGINIRPYALECLRRASQLFQIVVFTASHKSYADVVLDILDPKHEIFDMRLYRESCVRTQDGVYVKDLRIFEHCRSLSDLVLVDNAVYSFGYQLENGIPIIPFYEDKEDEELLHLSQYLECLAKNGGDVRDHNRKAFQLRELQELDVQQFLQNMITESQNFEQERAVAQQQAQYQQHQQQQQQQQQLQNKGANNNNSNSQWEILQMDSSVINEEPIEDEESSIQESNKLINRRRPRTQLNSKQKNEQQEFIEEEEEELGYGNGQEYYLDNFDNNDDYGEDYYTANGGPAGQRVLTRTSILDRDYNE